MELVNSGGLLGVLLMLWWRERKGLQKQVEELTEKLDDALARLGATDD